MDTKNHSPNGNTECVSVLFGPQSVLTSDTILQLRATLQEHQELRYLSQLIAELPSLWPSIVEVWPDLNAVPARVRLDELSAFFTGGPLIDITTPVNNILLSPLTVIIQIVDFWKLTHGLGHALKLETQLRDVQGFCTGFLTAIIVSCAKNEAEFQVLASKAVRLALCLGAAVDLDSLSKSDCAVTMAIRWKSVEQLQGLQSIMKQYPETYVSVITDSRTATFTVANRDELSIKSDLSKLNIPVIPLSPRGRWHHPDHSEGLQAILSLCQADERFRLPDADALNSRVLSNVDGNPTAKDSLHSVVLRCILTTQARWDLMFETLSEKGAHHISIGDKVAIPRRSNGDCVFKIPDMFVNHVSDEHRVTEILYSDPNIEYLKSLPQDDVAIIGMACRYPEADDVEQLWDLISDGRCVTRAFPEERFKMSELRREPQGPFYGGFVRDLAAFDNRFFGIPGREAKSMDPQQRMCLQVAYEAIESAGYYGLRSDEFDQDVGCYIGCANDDYLDNVASHPASAFSLTGTLRSFVSGRVSHHLGWTGPSMILDTACSASAVAIHTACKALKTNDCSVAVTGGVCSMSSARMTQHLIAAKFLSPTGASKAFDADADGYCRAEGAGLVVLRLLKDAIEHGDNILGVISGTAINQGSNETAIFVPDGRAQDLLYQKVLTTSRTAPEEITYVEAHGTGTQTGDPTEFEGIRKILGGAHRKDDVFVGSVKDNIGHTEASSGTASLIKTILMMQKGTIPKQANFKRLNPRIRPLGEDRVLIPTESREWRATRRTAMINNYGSCGSNAAIVLKDPTVVPSASAHDVSREMSYYPVFISGKTVEALRAFSRRLKDLLIKNTNDTLSSVAYNLAVKQNRNFEFSMVLISGDKYDLQGQLERAASGATDVFKVAARKPAVVLCFGGQNGKVAHISKDLYNKSVPLQRHITECDRVCTKELSLPSLFPTIFDPEPIGNIVNLHCVLFAVQYACAKAWLDSGLKVDRLLGHSFGQLTALCVSGSISLIDAMRLVSARAHLIETKREADAGLMLAFEGSTDSLRQCLELAKAKCEHFLADIACYNGPHSFVVAGDRCSITAVEQASRVMPNATRTTLLENSHAFHSRLLDGIMPELLQTAKELRITTPTIPIEACSDEDWSHITPEKIARHTREPVHFAEAVTRIEAEFDSPVVWLEAGSGSPVMPMLKRAVNSSDEHIFIPTLLRESDAQLNLAKATCHLWSHGIKAQFWPFHRSQSAWYRWINLPPYQFAKTNHWLEYMPNPVWDSPAAVTLEDHRKELVRLLPDQKDASKHLFEINPRHDMFQLGLKGHAIGQQQVCPASMYVELVLIAARLLSDTTALVPHVSDLILSSPLALEPAGPVLLKLAKHNTMPASWTFSLFTHDERNTLREPCEHTTGRINALPKETSSTAISHFRSTASLILQRCSEIENSPKSMGFKGPTVYQAISPAVAYLDYYQGVQSIYSIGNEAMARIALPTARPADTGTGFCDPVLIDSFIQVSSILANCFARDDDHETWVCDHVGEIAFTPRFVETARMAKTWVAYSKYEIPTPKRLQCDVFVFEPDSSQLVLTIMGIEFRRHSSKAVTQGIVGLNTRSESHFQDVAAKVVDSLDEPDTATRRRAQPPVTPPFVQQELLEKSREAYEGLERYKGPATVAATPAKLDITGTASTDGTADTLLRVKHMLSDIIEVPVEDIMPDSNFESLGVDSLFVTEIFMEANQRFGISLSHAEFRRIQNVQDLAQRISGSISTPSSNRSSIVDTISTSTSVSPPASNSSRTHIGMETLIYGERDGTLLSADIYYPAERVVTEKPLAVALLIHGGGHTMSTRKDIRHDQTQALLKSGFVAVSVDYRLCPEVTLKEGPMRDVCDALVWIRNELPQLTLGRSDIRIDGQRVVAVGWSSGGHLAMSLGWTARSLGVAPPEAVLAFYCPTDYEDAFWSRPNLPYSQRPVTPPDDDDDTYHHLYEGLQDKPVVGYTPAPSLRALGGWMSPDDPRSRIVLHMHWRGKHLPVLLGGLRRESTGDPAVKQVTTPVVPSVEQIRDVSPLARVRAGDYATPTFLVHGTRDDHVPWRQSQRTYEALVHEGVVARLALVRDAVHLFDMLRGFARDREAVRAVEDGLGFLRMFV